MVRIEGRTEVPDPSSEHLCEGKEETSDPDISSSMGYIPDPNETNDDIINHGAVIPGLVSIS